MRSLHLFLNAVLLAATLGVSVASAEIVFDNGVGGASGVSQAQVSDTGISPENIRADDFVLSESERITEVQWTGLYSSAQTLSDNFTIAIHSDADSPLAGIGLPSDTPLATFQVGSRVNRAFSGFTLGSNSISVFDYSATIDFEADSGTRYWLSIYNKSPASNQVFGWASPTPAGGPTTSALRFDGTWTPDAVDYDFRLVAAVPEPDSIVGLLSLVVSGMTFRHRERKKTV